jgi:hypothetical protein
MTKMKTLDEYAEIALDMYGSGSHAVTWITAQQSNKGKVDMSDESMMKMLERMDAKTAVKTTATQLPPPVPEVKAKPADNSQMKSMFDRLKKK